MQFAIGCDIEENKRFENKTLENNARFLNRIFTQKELEYCFSKKIFSQHLCARFCAKEAIVKALYSLDIKNIMPKDIEILNNNDGCPIATLKKYNYLNIKISLSHCKEYSTANTLITFDDKKITIKE